MRNTRLYALPVFGKPLIQVRAAHDLTMFESPVPFVPRLSFLPSSSIRTWVFKVISDIFSKRGLVVFGNEHIVSLQPMNLPTHLALGMQGVQAENAPFDPLGRQEWLEFADLIVFLLHIAVPQHAACCHARNN